MTKSRSAVSSLFALLVSFSSGLADAAEPTASASVPGATAATTPPAALPAASAAAQSPPLSEPNRVAAGDQSDASQPPSTSLVERLPPSAYPAPRVRGIYGGSLWAIFHGLQWPFYPKTGIGVSGSVWIDTGYERITSKDPTVAGYKNVIQQGRFLLRVTPTWSDGKFFVQGQAELVANKDQSVSQSNAPIADADDVWVRAGRWNKWDIQAGRFEGWEVYHLGMGLDLNTLERNGANIPNLADHPPDFYGVTYAFYRPPSVGQIAFHFYPTNFLRFELGTEEGSELGSNVLAVRPIAILDLGWVKAKVGAEYRNEDDQSDLLQTNRKKRGAGGSLQFVLDPYVEAGVNGARGLVDAKKGDGNIDETGSFTTTSVGAFANGRIFGDLILGVGANLTNQDDLHYDATFNDVEHFRSTQIFGALQYIVAKQLFIKAVGSYAKYEAVKTFVDPATPTIAQTMLSGRLRVMYLF